RSLLGDGDEILRLLEGDGMIQSVSRRNRADQDQHDQTHSLLTIVRSMEETDAGASEDQQATDIKRRRLGSFGGAIKLLIFDESLCQEKQQSGDTETHQGRKQQRF